MTTSGCLNLHDGLELFILKVVGSRVIVFGSDVRIRPDGIRSKSLHAEKNFYFSHASIKPYMSLMNRENYLSAYRCNNLLLAHTGCVYLNMT